MGVASWFFQDALASSFSSPPPPAPTPAGVGELSRTVRHCAVDKARRLIPRSIDPDSIHLESGNPLPDAEMALRSPKSRNCLGAYLICRRLCEGDIEGLPVHPDDLLLAQGFDFDTSPLKEEWVNRLNIQQPINSISLSIPPRRPHRG